VDGLTQRARPSIHALASEATDAENIEVTGPISCVELVILLLSSFKLYGFFADIALINIRLRVA
jgi:hypothetical protein